MNNPIQIDNDREWIQWWIEDEEYWEIERTWYRENFLQVERPLWTLKSSLANTE